MEIKSTVVHKGQNLKIVLVEMEPGKVSVGVVIPVDEGEEEAFFPYDWDKKDVDTAAAIAADLAKGRYGTSFKEFRRKFRGYTMPYPIQA